MQRRKARQRLLELLFQQEFRAMDPQATLEERDQDPFLLETLCGIAQHRQQLDELIASYTRGWALERLQTVDRNILRLALYELLHTQTPAEVVINEAVELAKRFGAEHSAAFVNGLLDRAWKSLKAAQPHA